MKLFFVDGIDKVTWRPTVFECALQKKKQMLQKKLLKKEGMEQQN